MKKFISVMLVLFLTIAIIQAKRELINAEELETITQEETNKGILIHENLFPSEAVRVRVCEKIDINQDGYLSETEIKSVKYFGVDLIYLQEEDLERNRKFTEEEKEKRYDGIDCTGLDIFYNLESVYLGLGNYEEGKYDKTGLKNYRILRKLKKIKSLYISGDRNHSYNLKGFRKLTKVDILDCTNVKKVLFGKKSKIKKLNINGTFFKYNLNLSNLKNLEILQAEHISVNKIKFGRNNKRLKSVIMYPYETGRCNNKTIDLRMAKNLRELEVGDFKKLKSLKLGKKNKLKNIFIYGCPKLKTINIKGCKYKRKLIKKIRVDNIIT